jgi:hypothetical protein
MRRAHESLESKPVPNLVSARGWSFATCFSKGVVFVSAAHMSHTSYPGSTGTQEVLIDTSEM